MKNGIDTGFCLNYSKLSFRRKFYSNLWCLLISLIGGYSIFQFSNDPGVVVWVLVLASIIAVPLCIIGGIYSLIRWRLEIKENPERCGIA